MHFLINEFVTIIDNIKKNKIVTKYFTPACPDLTRSYIREICVNSDTRLLKLHTTLYPFLKLEKKLLMEYVVM